MPWVSQDYLLFDAIRATELYRTHANFGFHPDAGDNLLVPDEDRYAGTYILGVQGSGKSGLLENLIMHDIQGGDAVIVIDPHGDLVTNCLSALPVEQLHRTFVLSMEDEAWPYGLNIFTSNTSTSVEVAKSVNRLLHLFSSLWPETVTQQHLPLFVQACALTLIANPGTTLMDMYRLMLDAPYRSKLLANVPWQDVKDFWRTHYDDVPTDIRISSVRPLVNRLHGLFMGKHLLRNILGQSVSTINFRQVVEQQRIIFIPLPGRTMEYESRLIGGILVAQLQAAVFSFADTPEHKRPRVAVYIDEFANFATPDMATLFSEGRKYKIKLTIGHQARTQLPKFLQDMTVTAKTIVCFRTQLDDASALAKLFPNEGMVVKPDDIDPKVSSKLIAYAYDYGEQMQGFVDTYLLPMSNQRRQYGKLIMTKATHGMFTLLTSNGQELPEITADDPTQRLDDLFYRVMKSGDPTLPIHPDIVRGFSNCGDHSFFHQSLKVGKELHWQLEDFPISLVHCTNTVVRWLRPPVDGKEQMLHFLFCLRVILTILADNPIGKESNVSTTEVAQTLLSLPVRTALVRSGDTLGVMQTHDVPPRLGETGTNKRFSYVLNQTRAVYCHPREEVERLFETPVEKPVAPEAPVKQPRWEKR